MYTPLFIFTCLSLLRADGNIGCTDGDKTYIVNFHAHVQNEVKDAIVSLAAKLNSVSIVDEIQGEGGESSGVTATKSYLGTIMDEVNADLRRLNVQINLIFEKQEIDQISSNGSYDPSCEISSPVKNRTESAYVQLKQKYENSVGIHFYIFGCIHNNPDFDKIDVISNSNCGRVIGIMWEGSKDTKTLIKSAIIEALTGSPDAYAKGSLSLQDKNSLCSYTEKCIGASPSQLGQMLEFKKNIRFTKDESSSESGDQMI
jgi:hypothetical protein